MRIAYVKVFVSNLLTTVAFYKDTLGLALQFSSSEHSFASFSAGDLRLGLAVPGDDQAALIGRHTGIGFEVADLESTYTRLSQLGAKFTMPPTRQPWSGFIALVADIDGNIFYLDQVATSYG